MTLLLAIYKSYSSNRTSNSCSSSSSSSSNLVAVIVVVAAAAAAVVAVVVVVVVVAAAAAVAVVVVVVAATAAAVVEQYKKAETSVTLFCVMVRCGGGRAPKKTTGHSRQTGSGRCQAGTSNRVSVPSHSPNLVVKHVS